MEILLIPDDFQIYKATVTESSPGSDISDKKKYEKIFLGRLFLNRFFFKTLRTNEIAIKKFLKMKKVI